MDRIQKGSQQSKWRRLMVLAGIFIILLCLSSTRTEAAVADYAGIYSITCHGTEELLWTGRIEADGGVFMIIWSTNQSGGISAQGTVDDAGNFSAANTDFDFSTEGNIISESGVSVMAGIWDWSGEEGDLVGQRHGATEYQAMTGSYQGTFAGDYNGTWNMCINADGGLAGQTYNPEYNVTEEVIGALVSGTTLLAFGGQSMALYAVIDSGVTIPTISGEWYRTTDQTSGTFQGLKISDNCNSNPNVGRGGGGGGGGGCLILTAGEPLIGKHPSCDLTSLSAIVIFTIFLINRIFYQAFKKKKRN